MDASQPDMMAIYDEVSGGHLACRVCGSLVPGVGDYAQIHWDWHEASHGA